MRQSLPKFDLPGIRRRLTNHQGKVFPPKHSARQAAVAVILRQFVGRTEILFIKRADKKGDPWSGQMAFPGGHLDKADADLKAAAMRETEEGNRPEPSRRRISGRIGPTLRRPAQPAPQFIDRAPRLRPAGGPSISPEL